MNRSLTLALAPLWLATAAQAANTAPTVVIQSAAMRGATGLMDVVFRVNDPDDATVKTRALAFIDGQRSFAKLVKPTTFADGTGSKIGDAIATNTNHTLTWNVASDWNIDLGQIKFEILAMDTRGLLPLDWVTIPAANGQPEVTISKNAPTDREVLNALFWQYASGDPGLTLENGALRGNDNSGVFAGVPLAGEISTDPNTNTSTSTYTYATPFIAKRMNLALADERTINNINRARRNWLSPDEWHLLREDYAGTAVILSSRSGFRGHEFSVRGTNGRTMTGGGDTMVINMDGTVAGAPDWVSGVVDGVREEYGNAIAIQSDGNVLEWGTNTDGLLGDPTDLTIAKSVAFKRHNFGLLSLAVSGDNQLALWGTGFWNESPPITTNISSAIKVIGGLGGANSYFVMTLDGTLYRINDSGPNSTPSVQGIASDCLDFAAYHNSAIIIKSDRSIEFAGGILYDGTQIPQDLNPSRQVAIGGLFSMSLSVDGLISIWPHNLPSWYQPTLPTIPSGFSKADSIAATSIDAIIFRSKSL